MISKQRLDSIHMLRGAAAMMVVLYHFQYLIAADWPTLSWMVSHGPLGVDVFFFISGFVIYNSTQALSSRSARPFLTRRFFRVVVPAWCAMALLLFVKPPYLKDLIFSVLFIPLKNSHPPGYGYSFLIVAWTLTYELVFYAIFALTLTTSLGKKYRGWISATLICGMVLGVQALTHIYTLDSGAVGLFPTHAWFPSQVISLLANPLFLEFVVGMALGYLYQQGVFTWLASKGAAFLALMAGLLLVVCFFQYQPGNGWTNSGLFAMVVVILALAYPLSGAPNSPRPPLVVLFCFFGEISFSIYLIHPVLRALVSTQPEAVKLAGIFGGLAMFALLIGVTIVAGIFFYKIVEIPAQQLGKRLTLPSTTVPVAKREASADSTPAL